MPIHIHPTAELAPRALLPADPGRALALAQLLTSGPKMFNHNQGLWGYTGTASDGEPLTIQSTGIGGPSAAIVLEELCDLGLRRAIRVGACRALEPTLALGDLVIADAALARDGTSRALGAGDRVGADSALVESLRAAAGEDRARIGAIVSSDLFYDRDETRARAWESEGAVAIEMEAAALLRVGELRGVRVACLLAVSDVFDGAARQRLGGEGLARCGDRLGELAAAALSRGVA